MYLFIKSVYIIFYCLMAGMFYLPRLFVYHSEKDLDETYDNFLLWKKLIKIIMNPAMIVIRFLGMFFYL